MKFDCGPTAAEKAAEENRKHEAKKQWHPYFCWRPRRVGSHDCRWLEWIERRGTWHIGYDHYYWSWEYRPKS